MKFSYHCVMEKEELKKFAQNPKHIPGIYNYCDRWCERCSFTARCLNYAMQEEDIDDPKSADIASKAFWKKIDDNLTMAMEMLQDMAAEQGIDLNDIDAVEATQHRERTREAAESHELSQSAHKYADLVDSWFDKNQEIFKQREKDLKIELSIGLEQKKLVNEARSIIDATEVISWYQDQIYVKIIRSLTFPENAEKFEDEIQNDSNGSAKVALIGMDRSIGAWARLNDHFPEQTDEILDVLLHLDRLRKKTEKVFPNARIFQRPGFDSI